MIITLTRTGGFTGIPQKKIIDTKTLDSAKAKKIEELVSESNFFTCEISFPKPTPDRFTYTIAIQNEAVSRSLPIPEESLTPEIKELIECLQSI